MFKIFARYWLFLYICIKQLTKKETFFQNCGTYCRVVKQADTPPCLGGGE